MYEIQRKEEAIRSLQRYLSTVGERHISPSGIYDSVTREAVGAFQSRSGLNETGVADRNTFEAIAEAYSIKQAENTARGCAGDLVKFPIKLGDSGSEIYRINSVLSRLALYYRESHGIKNSAYFGSESARITARLREIFGLSGADSIDEQLYLRLLLEADAIEKTTP